MHSLSQTSKLPVFLRKWLSLNVGLTLVCRARSKTHWTNCKTLIDSNGYWVRLLFGFPLRPVWFIVEERGCVSSSYKDLWFNKCFFISRTVKEFTLFPNVKGSLCENRWINELVCIYAPNILRLILFSLPPFLLPVDSEQVFTVQRPCFLLFGVFLVGCVWSLFFVFSFLWNTSMFAFVFVFSCFIIVTFFSYRSYFSEKGSNAIMNHLLNSLSKCLI